LVIFRYSSPKLVFENKKKKIPMILTDYEIQPGQIIDAKDIAGNAAIAAKKYLAEACVVQQEQQRILKRQKEKNWSLYINQLES
jgi:hypothetical protein